MLIKITIEIDSVNVPNPLDVANEVLALAQKEIVVKYASRIKSVGQFSPSMMMSPYQLTSYIETRES